MWHLALMAVVASGSTELATAERTTFGPRLTLTCTWFTNFENSRFNQCRTAAGKELLSADGASLECRGRTCQQLDAEARRLANLRSSEIPSGSFTVRLVGRVSYQEHAKRYAGDGTRTVLVEKLLSVTKPK